MHSNNSATDFVSDDFLCTSFPSPSTSSFVVLQDVVGSASDDTSLPVESTEIEPLTPTNDTHFSTVPASNSPINAFASPTYQLSVFTPKHSGSSIKPPSYFMDFLCSLLQGCINTNTLVPNQFKDTQYPLSIIISYDNLFSAHNFFTINVSSLNEHSSYLEAIKDSNWRVVINSELQLLLSNNTCELTNLPSNKKVVACK